MSRANFVAGDWGTSQLRLFLCDADGLILDSATGPGAASASGRFENIFEGFLRRWQTGEHALPAVLSGMVGSSFGWTQAPYVACPAVPESIADGCVSIRGGSVHIVPGVSCRNRFNSPDFMRGEETQILGALHSSPVLRRGHHLLCLPGTHTKWVVLEEGAIREFLTAPTGEIFALLRDHSVLARDGGKVDAVVGGVAFEEGLEHFNDFPQAQLLHRLFECRSRRLNGELTPQAAAAYLSGLLIASDISGALRLLSGAISARTVHLIGAPALVELYASGLASHNYGAIPIDGDAAALAGLAQVHRQLAQQRVITDAAS